MSEILRCRKLVVSHRINYCSHQCDKPDRNKLKEERLILLMVSENHREEGLAIWIGLWWWEHTAFGSIWRSRPAPSNTHP